MDGGRPKTLDPIWRKRQEIFRGQNHEVEVIVSQPIFGLTMDRMNRLYMGIVTGWGAVIGSAVSFMVGGAFIWAIVRLLRRDFPLSRVREARIVALIFAAFFAIEALAGAISYNGVETLLEVGQNTLYLAFLPIYSRLSVSERLGVRDAVELAAMGGAYVAFAIALVESFGLGLRAEGGAGNAFPFALANFMTLTITFLASQRAQGGWRVLFALAALASVGSIILSGTRGLWPGLVIAPAISIWFYRDHLTRRYLLPSIAVFSVALAAFALIATPFVRDRVELLVEDYGQIMEEGDYSGSVGKRVIVWKAGWQLVTEAPFFGHGPGHSEDLMIERTRAISGTPLSYSHFHNVFLNYAVRDGIPGALIVAMMVFGPVMLAWRTRRDEMGDYGLALTAGIAASFFLSGLFNNMIGHDLSDSLFLMGTLTGLFLVFGPSARPGSGTE
jgi:O-antigen ligase